jgi:hypothetical protein
MLTTSTARLVLRALRSPVLTLLLLTLLLLLLRLDSLSLKLLPVLLVLEADDNDFEEL